MKDYEIIKLKERIIKPKNEIITLEEYLKEHPEDLGVQLSLCNQKCRLDEMEFELSLIHENVGAFI